MTVAENKRIAIIGAGPCGAVALDTFLDYGFKDIQVFERRSVTGGTWASDKDLGQITPNTDCTIYPDLETNILPELMSFSKRPYKRPPVDSAYGQKSLTKFGTATEAFVPAEVIKSYVDSFFEDRSQYVRFNTAVDEIRQVDGPGSKWIINSEIDNLFDYIYIATGRFHQPKIPYIEGSQLLPREIMSHSQEFRAAKEFKEKKVLLIGASISSTDIVHLIKDYVKTPIILSVRGCLSLIEDAFEQPFIDARPRVQEFSPGTDAGTAKAKFEDGTIEDNIEAIIYGTGYKFEFPFLQDYINKHGNGGITPLGLKNFYLTTWWNEDPSLAVAGLVTDGLTWRAMDYQAKATAQLWSGSVGAKLPNKEKRLAWEVERRAKEIADWHSWYPQDKDFFDELVQVGWGSLDAKGALPAFDSSWRVTYAKGFNFKQGYWADVRNKYLAAHPETEKQYVKTSTFLKTRISPLPGEYGGARRRI